MVLRAIYISIFILFNGLVADGHPINKVPKNQGVPSVQFRCQRLAKHLCNGLTTEKDKTHAIFTWITHHIKYDIKSYQRGSNRIYTPSQVVRRKKAVCQGVADLFTELCKQAGLKVIEVEGYTKSEEFDYGDKLFRPEHVWNAVRIDGQWQLIDATFCLGNVVPKANPFMSFVCRTFKIKHINTKLKFVRHPTEDFYLLEPESFILTHVPTDPLWQLLPTKVSLTTFETNNDTSAVLVSKPTNPSSISQQVDLALIGSDVHQTINRCNRSIQFNEQNPRPNAEREFTLGQETTQQLANTTTQHPQDSLYCIATTHYQQAIEYIKATVVLCNQEFLLLEQKNSRKRQILFNEDDSLLRFSQSNIRQAINKRHWGKRAYQAEKKLLRHQMYFYSRLKLPDLDKTKFAKKITPELLARKSSLDDSLLTNKVQIDSLKLVLATQDHALSFLVNVFDGDLTTILSKNSTEKALLKSEESLRIYLLDSYKPEVKSLKEQVKALRDTCLAPYAANLWSTIDSIRVLQAEIRRNCQKITALHRRNITYIVQTKHTILADPNISQQYDDELDNWWADRSWYSSHIFQNMAIDKTVLQSMRKVAKTQKRINKVLKQQKATETLRWIWNNKHLKIKKQQELRRINSQKTTVEEAENELKKLKPTSTTN